MIDRRTLLAAFLGAPAALGLGCRQTAEGDPPAIPPGELVGASADFGHLIRDGINVRIADADLEQRDVVIIGGGVAGLTAARRLRRAGLRNVTLLELESSIGGTAVSGTSSVASFPWGAHYVPAPRKDYPALVELFDEMECFEGVDERGDPIPAEHLVARYPQERVFYKGSWYEGLYLQAGADAADKQQFETFHNEIMKWVRWRDSAGKRAFTLPLEDGSRDDEPFQLDAVSMAQWMDDHNFSSPRLRWYADYACRDDYGMRLEQTSAWAGIFYFASRTSSETEDSRPFITWPEGNGRIIDHLHNEVRDLAHAGWAVADVRPGRGEDKSQIDVVACSADGKQRRGIRCRRVIFAAPQFLTKYLIEDYRRSTPAHVATFEYGSWAVVNLHLASAPTSEGFPLAWDNVIYESPGLGYVAATYQRGLDYGPAIWTYYYPLTDADPKAARQRLLDVDREGWAEIALADLSRPHQNIREVTERVDVMRWGHAMILPKPGFISGVDRVRAAQPFRGIHFAHSDLSGVALFEEAFYRGLRAAEDVLESLGRETERTV
ncbi:MAG: FAD-dependent oxidoreductase [Pirellulaceae bacterium]|nr:FAD-dependent oxidoreductase [Pirellulaceae bacterium]